MRIAACSVVLLSCAPTLGPDAVAELRKANQKEIDELRAVQKQELATMGERVASLEARQEKLASQLADAEKKLADKPAAPKPRRHGPDPQKVYAFPVGDSPVRGRADAWVTIIEVSDFQCPFCKRVQPTLNQVMDEYGRDVRIVFKHNPLSFHVRAMPAAIASECAHQQQGFWPVHRLLFENQRELTDDDIERYVRKSGGINFKKWRACYAEQAPKSRILADQTKATDLGARGTPAFFINGRFLSGAQPLTKFKTLIDEELKKAKASGLERHTYYEKAVLSAK